MTQSRLYVLLPQSQHQPCWMSYNDFKFCNQLMSVRPRASLILLNIYNFKFIILKKGIFKGLFEKRAHCPRPPPASPPVSGGPEIDAPFPSVHFYLIFLVRVVVCQCMLKQKYHLANFLYQSSNSENKHYFLN